MTKNQRYITISSIIIFTILFLITNWNGINFTPDSLAYIGTAETLNYNFSLLPGYTHWPPLYPIILSIGFNKIIIWATFLNYISIIFSITIWLKIGSTKLSNFTNFVFYALFISLSTPILANTHFVWSESLFILFFSLFCFSILSDNKGKYYDLIFFLTGILMCYQRNIALFLIIGFFIFSLFDKHKRTFSIKFGLIILFGSLWNIYQVFFNAKHELINGLLPYLDLTRNISIAFGEVYNWLLPSFGLGVIEIIISLILIIFISFNIFRSTNNQKYLAGGLLFYIICFLLIPASVDDIARLLSVIFYPAIFYLFLVIDNEKFHQKIIIILLSFSIFYQIARVSKNAINWNKSGVFEINKNENIN